MMRRSVVLPDPDGPSSASNSPDWMSRFTLSSAVKDAEALGGVENGDSHRIIPLHTLDSSATFAIRVTSASSARSDATAKAAMNWYSL